MRRAATFRVSNRPLPWFEAEDRGFVKRARRRSLRHSFRPDDAAEYAEAMFDAWYFDYCPERDSPAEMDGPTFPPRFIEVM